MTCSLGGIGSGLQIGAFRKVPPAFVVIGRALRIFPPLHCGLGILLPAHHFDHTIRTIGTDVVPDDSVACVGVVACQSESIRSVPEQNRKQARSAAELRCGPNHDATRNSHNWQPIRRDPHPVSVPGGNSVYLMYLTSKTRQQNNCAFAIERSRGALLQPAPRNSTMTGCAGSWETAFRRDFTLSPAA